MKSTKKSLLLSTISLVLCFAMLLGTTWAWFTDEVTSGVNKIVAGNLDIEVSYKDGTEWKSIEGVGSLFSNSLWEPGHTEYVTLKIENKGSLALTYKMMVTPVNEAGGINMAGQPFKLSDYLVFGTANATAEGYATREAARAAAGDTMKLNQAGLVNTGAKLAVGGTEYVTLVVYMPESVGNEANYKTGTAAPTIDLGIKVVATQVENENDSFGNDYDEDAAYDPDKNTIVYNYFPQVAQSATLKKNGENVTANGAVVDNGKVTIKSAVKVKEVTGVAADAEKEFASVQLPAATVTALLTDENDHIIALNVQKDDDANANFKTATGAPNLADKETTTYEVNVTKDGVKVSTTGKLYTVKMFIGENKQNLVMYHNNTQMTKVTDTPDADDEYNYNPNDGYVTMCVSSFSPFTSVYDEPAAAIGTKVYYSLESAIAAAQANDTVVLLKNVDLDTRVDINKKLTLDLNGKTVKPMDSLSEDAFKPLKSGGATSNGYATGVIAVLRDGDLTVNDSAGSGKIAANGKTYAAICMTVTGETENGNAAKLTVNGGTLEGYYYSIVGNGSRHNTEITINGGTFKGTCTKDHSAIFHPQNGTMTINGGTFEGYNTAIEMRAGTLNINGGTFTAMAEEFDCKPNGSGSTTVGAAIAIAQHTTKKDIVVTISGGTFTGAKALNESNPQANDPTPQVTMSITGGTFNGEVSLTDVSKCITGGTFSSDPKAYVAEGCKAVDNGNGTWTVNFGVAQIVETGAKYGSLAEAISAATTGQTIKMLCDTEYTNPNFVLDGVNLDLNNYKIKVTRPDGGAKSFQLKGDVIISNGSIEASLFQNNQCAIYVVKAANATLNNVNVKAYRTSDNAVAYGIAPYNAYMDDPNGGIVINGGTFESSVGSNGSTRGGYLTINSGTFKEDLYLPAYMTYTIAGGTFEKRVEFRSGIINITGGEFKNSGTPANLNVSQDITIDGCSIGLVAHNGPLDNSHDSGYGPTPVLTITGGTFAGQIGLARKNATFAYPTVTATGVTVTTVELGVNAQ